MKIFLPSLFLFAFSFNSCSKFHPENKLRGAWQLKVAERNSSFNWRTVTTGYENATFNFLEGGSMTFTDNQGNMSGEWRVRKVRDNWQDDEGYQQWEIRNALSIHLYNFADNRVLNLDFDDIRFRGRDRLFGEYKSRNDRYRYEFVRY